jgi:hypothetical protein
VQSVTTTTAAATAADWRAKLGARVAPAAASPTAAAPATAPSVSASDEERAAAPASPTAAAPATAPSVSASDEERAAAPAWAARRDADHSPAGELHWRDELCDWAAAVLAHPRNARPLPSLAHCRLDDAIERLRLETPSARALALLYGARLLGQHELPAATVARAIGDGEPADDPAWCEALARGPLAERRLVRQRRGRLGLRAIASRFLDGAEPHVTLLEGVEGAPESHLTLRLSLESESLERLGARLVREHGHHVALITIDEEAPCRSLADALCEARLYDAWPLIEDSGEPAEWLPALDGGPVLIAVRGEPTDLLATLPEL